MKNTFQRILIFWWLGNYFVRSKFKTWRFQSSGLFPSKYSLSNQNLNLYQLWCRAMEDNFQLKHYNPLSSNLEFNFAYHRILFTHLPPCKFFFLNCIGHINKETLYIYVNLCFENLRMCADKLGRIYCGENRTKKNSRRMARFRSMSSVFLNYTGFLTLIYFLRVDVGRWPFARWGFTGMNFIWNEMWLLQLLIIGYMYL